MKSFILKLFMFASVLFLSGCSVDGMVKDENGNAIDQAQVMVITTAGTLTTQTDADGQYNVSDLDSSGTVSVTISKDGFETQTQNAELSSSGISLDFILIATDNTPAFSTVSGIIKDTTGSPLEGVTVSSNISSTVTTIDGKYTLNANIGEKVSITASLTNYAENSRNVRIIKNETSTLNLTLVSVDKIVSFDVNTGATITTKGASIELGASSIVNLDGSAYTGNVTAKVSFNQVTNITGREVFPGEYVGLETNGDETLLISYGFIDVTLEDNNANKLRLADGATATLTYPMDTNIEATPATIPLWYYDTVKGIWIEDGLATYDATTNTYSGTVSHFTSWNLDAKGLRATLNGCVEDINGNRVPNAEIILTTPGYYNSFYNQDINGEFGFYNAPAAQTLSLRAVSDSLSSSALVLNLNTGETKNLQNCLVLDQGLPEEHTLFGKFILSDGSALSNQYINFQDSNGLYLGGAQIDINGNLIDATFTKPQDNIIVLNDTFVINNNPVYFEQSFTLDTNSETTNIGTVEVKTTEITGCVQRADGSNSFDLIEFKKDSPYGYDSLSIESDGSFSIIVGQDFKDHTFYIFADPSNAHTISFTANANTAAIDLGSSCLVLEDSLTINKTTQVNITTSTNKTIMVQYSEQANYEYPNSYGQVVLDSPSTSASFNLTQNGVYYVYQKGEQYAYQNFDGTISISVDGQTNTIMIPQGANTYENWLGQAIEVYQGQIKIIEINKPTEQPS